MVTLIEETLEQDTGRTGFFMKLVGCGKNDYAAVGEDICGWWYEACVDNIYLSADYSRYEREEAIGILLRKLDEHGIAYETEEEE